MSPAEAAPLGLFSVAAVSIAAAAPQLRERTVNHRIGVTTELAATTGAVVGAIVSGAVGDTFLRLFLAFTALAGAVAGAGRRGVRNPAREGYGPELVGEWPHRWAGAYRVNGGIAPYEASRIPAGLGAMLVSGLVAGIAGTSGGFIKTPATSEIMRVPVKVAAATTTFTIGVTAAAALCVFGLQGRIETRDGAAVVIAAVAGGWLGAHLQTRLAPQVVRRALSVVLIAVAIVLIVTA